MAGQPHPEDLFDPRKLPGQGRIWVAFSGGPDSCCLLHFLLSRNPERELCAVHIDHGLDPGSGERARRAVGLAESWGVAVRGIRVDPDPAAGGGPEAAARRARYLALESLMAPGEALLTAHTADDQVETVLLRLMRGAGAGALAGMAARRRFGPGWHLRPLLGVPRRRVLAYVEEHGLDPVTDPTNLDPGLDRNFLRLEVLPLLAGRWPGYRAAVLRSARLLAGAGRAVEEQARRDLSGIARRHDGELVIDRERWQELDEFRAAEVLRRWIAAHGLKPPPAARLEAFIAQSREAAADRSPALDFHGAVVRAHGELLWFDPKPPPPRAWKVDWQPPAPAVLPEGLGRLRLAGPAPEFPAGEWAIRSGRPGERIRLPGRNQTTAVSELLRAGRIPPWRRPAVPRVWYKDRLMAVAGRWLEEDFARLLETTGCRLEWETPEPAGTI